MFIFVLAVDSNKSAWRIVLSGSHLTAPTRSDRKELKLYFMSVTLQYLNDMRR